MGGSLFRCVRQFYAAVSGKVSSEPAGTCLHIILKAVSLADGQMVRIRELLLELQI